MPDTQLQYRLYDDKDLYGVLDLWEKHSGWGGISKEQFCNWYINTPNGPCIIVVATNETNEIVGQEVFIPAVIQVKDKKVKALRVSAPILHENYRETPITRASHPAYAMLRSGIDAAYTQGYKVVYMYPALGWVTLMKLLPKFNLPRVDATSFDCFSISLEEPDTLYPHSEDLEITELKAGFHAHHDDLWNEAINSFPISCGIVRNNKWLNWKNGGHLALEIRDKTNHLLTGYVTIKKQTGLIEDMLARTEADAEKILKAVIRAVHHNNPTRIPFLCGEINGMYTAMFQKLLINIKHEFKNFRFGFGCFSLDDSISEEDIRPATWYMMPND